MTKRMLIDGSHPEEARVVITDANRLEEYDVETSTKQQLKGNIYLAKVTRVEPSLQAAFVDFGGNRHGFLAFNDIHPDYFQIPIEDREALIAAESAEHKDEDDDAVQALVDEIDGAIGEQDDEEAGSTDDETLEDVTPDVVDDGEQPLSAADSGADEAEDPEPIEPLAEHPEDATREETIGVPTDAITATDSIDTEATDPVEEPVEAAAEEPQDTDDAGEEDVDAKPSSGAQRRRRGRGQGRNGTDAGSGDAEYRPARRRARRYNIQEVIKRRQLILVQVVKEERGNKGAALTTYISLAGRYCVLMPNTARGGGISRKITNTSSRRKLKEILSDLEIQEGMGVIMRTAGMERNKSEIKRDFEYLIRAWDDVREHTMQAMAPALVYGDASLIKRAIRDLYTKDIEEVLIEGTETYQTAKKFMRLMMPSHAKRVQPYRDENIPLFHRYQVEGQLDAMHSPEVRLKAGGYIVIHSTEALVAIDVNSGKSTRERNIEETAVKTNLEAADEVARQLRLRDLAGLVVIDFIDMDESRHLRQVERRLKDALKPDRARIQIGRISGFGLLEMSRQRLRPSLQEASTQICRYCQGQGFIRSTESMALVVLRALEEEGIRHRSSEISVAVPTSVALYVLNNKRKALSEIEARHGFAIGLVGDDTVIPPDMKIERIKALPSDAAAERAQSSEESAPADAVAVETLEQSTSGEEEGERKRPRRRRSRRKAPAAVSTEAVQEPTELGAESEPVPDAAAAEETPSEEAAQPRRRRRGRRGGRGRGGRNGEAETTAPTVGFAAEAPQDAQPEAAVAEAPNNGDVPEAMPAVPAPVSEPTPVADDPTLALDGSNGEGVEDTAAQPGENNASEAPTSATVPHEIGAENPPRRGWWQRLVE